MQNLRYNKYWILSATIAFVILFTFLIVDIYQKTLEDEKQNHQNQQLQMVKATTQGIDFFIKYLVNDLRFLSNSVEIQNNANSAQTLLELFLGHQNNLIITSIFLTDRQGSLLFHVGITPSEKASAEAKDHIHAGKRSGGEYILTNVSFDSSSGGIKETFFQLILPIVAQSQKRNQDTLGYIGYIVNFNLLMEQFIEPLKLTKDDFAWVIDGNGRLIFHPLHEEMLFLSINKTETECYDCHYSFETQKKLIAANTASVGEYTVIGDEPRKIMAYAPLHLQSSKWIIVISTFVPKVTEGLRDKFRGFFILGFVILGVILFFSSLVYIINSKRIRAEEAKRGLEQIQEFREQLNQSSRLASIGELVDYVAHEINTPAGIISAHVDALLLSGNKTENLDAALALIKKQTKRISEYTSTLLNYSGRIPYSPEPVDLTDILNECTNVLAYRYKPKRISIEKQFEENIPKILADAKQMEQVFINILNNAIDAITSRGTIRVAISKSLEEKKESIEILVEDNGSGIKPEILDKVFTPFFSTKKNQGTGLGLSIVKAIVIRHGGEVRINSAPDKGTTVRIILPIFRNEIKYGS